MKQALGLIETIGLAAAIEAADAAVKAANVTLLGYENTRGSGKITVKIAGDVGAVKAGVAAAVAAASRVGKVYGQLVIARPHEEIDWLIRNLDRGRGLEEPGTEKSAQEEVDVEVTTGVDSHPNEETEEVRCAATTKSGEQCKLPAQSGSKYCFVHRSKAED